MEKENIEILIPKEKFNTGNLEDALNHFLGLLNVNSHKFEIDFVDEEGSSCVCIVLKEE